MKILLVYPCYPDTFWSFSHALRFIGKKASLPPMGLLTIAAMLPEQWSLKLVDLNVSSLKDEDILWADYVFLSAMTVQKASAKKIITRCLNLGRKVVAGGPLFTAESGDFPEVHHLVLNEAEITLPLFLKDLELGQPNRVYQSSEWADINTTPVPLWELINLKNYATMPVQYSRGCPFDCEFCDITVLFGRKTRTKSAELILNELEALYQKGWRGSVFFVDDNFIGNKKLIKQEILPALIKWMKRKKYPFAFSTQASINLADDHELMHLMAEAGFDMVFVGIETPDKDSLIECGKLHNTRNDLLTNVKKLHAAGLQVQAGFIVGFDSDKRDIFARMSQFINESGIVASMVGLLNAPPGTRLYKRLIKENRIIKQISGDNTDFSMNFLPKMDRKVLVDGYKKIISDIYRPEAYYKRIKTFLRGYRFTSKSRTGFSVRNLRGFTMSVYKLGIKKGVRRHYWKLMAWTLVRRPRLIPHAVTMTIYGAHFMRHFETVLESPAQI
ncbi:MAG: B12-binding domain-containing radical SAM protein [Candidatus Glassbacteria bacterium]|nr:B12-binding domain-containing radical SAM protein [Candidatus Glassbacteria bacterium]